MLYTSTVNAVTLSLLNELMRLSFLNDYSLVGGTALALQYGHRESIDLDLFTTEKLDYNATIEALKQHFGNRFFYEGNYSNFGIFCYIDNIKVDILRYPHARIAPLIISEDVRMYDSKDISAMKIQAILGRGRKKDFWDIYELLDHYTVKDIISNHKQKYPDQMLLISIPQALTYFEDAEAGEEPVSLKNQNWENIKTFIKQKVSEYLK